MTDTARLLVDVGNYRIKWGRGSGGTLSVGEPFPHDGSGLSGRLDEAWRPLQRPNRVAVSNVAGSAVSDAIRAWVNRNWQLEPEFPRARAAGYGIATCYQQPERLGVDRWLALIAARDVDPGAQVVVDCGTAITVDVLDHDGTHRGGVIAPGLNLMAQSLVQTAPGLQVNVADYGGILATNTAEGIAGGIRQAALGLIERIWSQAAHTVTGELGLVLTGGDAATLGSDLRIPYRFRPYLVLEGLMRITENVR